MTSCGDPRNYGIQSSQKIMAKNSWDQESLWEAPPALVLANQQCRFGVPLNCSILVLLKEDFGQLWGDADCGLLVVPSGWQIVIFGPKFLGSVSQGVAVSISWDVWELQSSVQGGLCETLLPVDTRKIRQGTFFSPTSRRRFLCMWLSQ